MNEIDLTSTSVRSNKRNLAETNNLYKLNIVTESTIQKEDEYADFRQLPSSFKLIQIDEETNKRTSSIEQILETAASDSTSLENKINALSMQHFRESYTTRLLQLLREQTFEYGVDTPVDMLVRESFEKNRNIAKEWLNDLFVKNFKDQVIVIGILRVISHINYDEISPQGVTMAIAALSHSDAEVRESGIRAFENWGAYGCLGVLEGLQCAEEWLNSYLQQVIADLRKE